MPAKFTGQKCDDCQGNLIYDRELKRWECPYCGKIYEKEYQLDKVQIDGLAGIQETVRVALIKLANHEMNEAKKDLLECEKMSASHIGTTLVNLTYQFMLANASNKNDVVNEIMPRIKKIATRFKADFPEIDAEELAFYQFIKNPELYAMLVVVYGFINEKERAEMMFDYFKVGETLNLNINNLLLKYLLKNSEFERIISLSKNNDGIDERFFLKEIMLKTEDFEGKREVLSNLLSKKYLNANDYALFNEYFKNSKDGVDIKLEVLTAEIECGISQNIISNFSLVLPECKDDATVNRAFSLLTKANVNSDELQMLIKIVLLNNKDDSICEKILKSLRENDRIYCVDSDIIIQFINSSNLSGESIVARLKIVLELFELSLKDLTILQNFILFEYRGSVRESVVTMILEKSKSLPLDIMERYVSTEEENQNFKFQIIKRFFEMKLMDIYYKNLLNIYALNTSDIGELRDKILDLFLENNLKADSKSELKLLLSENVINDESIIDRLIQCNKSDNTLKLFVENKSEFSQYDINIIIKLLEQNGYKADEKIAVRFLLEIDEEKDKNKVKHICAIFENNRLALDKDFQTIVINNAFATCNLAQEYLIKSDDSENAIIEILNVLAKNKVKVSEPIIDANQKRIKFKKFIEANSAFLTSKTLDICKQLKII